MAFGLSRRRFLALAGRAGAVLLATPGLAWAQERAREIHEATHNTLLGAVGVRLRQLFQGRPQPWKSYPNAPRTPLPDAESGPSRSLGAVLGSARSTSSPAAASIPLTRLTRVLEAANGVTGRGPGGIRLRAAPSAGALYAGELYVVAEAIEGLPSGLYYYAPLSRALVRLAKGSHHATVAHALETPGLAKGIAAAVLVTSVFPRYRWRYANRGYRYGLIDVGHIGENLRLASASADLAASSPRRFQDDRLNGLLEVDGLEEAVCAVHLLGGSGQEQAAATRRLVEAGRAGRDLPAAADDPPERYHARTRLVPTRGDGDAASAPEPSAGGRDARTSEARHAEAPEAADDEVKPGEASDAAATSAASTTLAPREDPGLAVERLIRRRRSARRFTPDPVAAEDLAFVLDAALARREREEDALSLRVFVHRALDLGPGLYRARRPASGRPELVREREGSLSAELVEACLGQEKAGAAAAAIAMVGAIEAAAEARGERSYRDLCLAAGACGQRIYLAAESLGLAARNLSAFVDDRLNALAGLDGRERAVLHLTLFGPGD